MNINVPQVNFDINTLPQAAGLLTNSLSIIIKVVVLVLLFVYLIFALVIVRQTKVMTDTVELGFETPIKIISYLHFLFALFILIYAFVVL